MVSAACAGKTALSDVASGIPICIDADVIAGEWVKLYWGTIVDFGDSER